MADDDPEYDAEGWHTLETARDQWTDAPYQDPILTDLLEVAKDACLAFAPLPGTFTGFGEGGFGEGGFGGSAGEVAVRYRVAQLMQARNVWNVSKVSPSGELGDGSYVITPKPLDWMIKQLLRPKRAVPVMF